MRVSAAGAVAVSVAVAACTQYASPERGGPAQVCTAAQAFVQAVALQKGTPLGDLQRLRTALRHTADPGVRAAGERFSRDALDTSGVPRIPTQALADLTGECTRVHSPLTVATTTPPQ
jgi:hypothetical protein